MMDQILINLRVLAKIKPQDKVDVWDSKIYVTTPTYFRSLKRIIFRQSRQASIDFIRKVISDSVEFSNALMNAKRQEFNTQTKSKSFVTEYNDNIAWSNECNLRDLFEELTKSKTGLGNLKVTYTEDATAVSQIEVISNSISNQVKAIQLFMSRENVCEIEE